MTEISEVQQTVVRNGDTEDVSHHRVFLLGENRWEEPSRLRTTKGADRVKNKDATTKCLQCRGEGRLLCTGEQLSPQIILIFQFFTLVVIVPLSLKGCCLGRGMCLLIHL